jgi:hypothetical protein
MKTITVKSRYGDVRSFVPVNENTFKFEGDTMYSRFGGVDTNDLEFFDPDGGPFISEGYMIGVKKVKRIMSTDGGIYFEVE